MSETKLKTWSAGGLGDAFIVGCKLNQLFCNFSKIDHINHLFVESNPKTLELIKEYVNYFWDSKRFHVDFKCDPDYQKSYFEGKWADYQPINTKIDGKYRFPGPDGIELKEDFATIRNNVSKRFDVCIQVAAGVKSNRKWKFDVFVLKNLLEKKGYEVALVGTSEEFQNDQRNNFVCKTDLGQSIDIVAASKIYVGLSGFHTFHSLARGIKNVHLEESPEHNVHYLHKSWEKNRYGIKHGSLAEVIAGLRHWGVEI